MVFKNLLREEKEIKDKKEQGFLKKLKEKMAKSKQGFIRQMDELLLGKKEISPELLEEIEEILVMADMGISTVQTIIKKVQQEIDRGHLSDSEALRQCLKEEIKKIFYQAKDEAQDQDKFTQKPHIIMVVGVNGVGKTTSIAKLAWHYKNQGKKVLLIAADTFRAAAIEQLEMWGERIGVPVFAQKSGSDPSAVAFDGIEFAKSKDIDVVIVDTAGRLHTQVNLMKELQKIKRVIGKKIDGAPHEVLLVLDATTGQNGLSQAKTFCEAIKVTGIILTKLDGTAKGGIVASIAHELKIPIKFIGIGEKMEDLRPFDPEVFVDALFEH